MSLPSDMQWGHIDENGTWNGLIGALNDRVSLQTKLYKHTQTLISSNPLTQFRPSIQDFDISGYGVFKLCKVPLISIAIETFDRLRSGLNSFHGELLLVDHHTKGGEHM